MQGSARVLSNFLLISFLTPREDGRILSNNSGGGVGVGRRWLNKDAFPGISQGVWQALLIWIATLYYPTVENAYSTNMTQRAF